MTVPHSSDSTRASIMIDEASKLGIDAGPEIVAILHELGFNRRHLGIVLDTGTGPFPDSHHWWRGDDDRYRSHDLK